VSTLVFRRFLSIPSQLPTRGLIKLNESSRFLQISGEDASSFINGLTTVKMVPTYLKKNQTTISEADINNENIVSSINISEDLIKSSNWGILHENEEFDPQNSDELPLRLGIRRDGRFAHILKANGRVFSDVFIYPTPFIISNTLGNSQPNYLIEILNKDQFKSLQMTLNLHKLRSKVDIKEINLSSWFYYDDSKKGLEVYDLLLDSYFCNGNSKDPQSANQLASDFLKTNILFASTETDVNKINGFAIDQRMDYFGIRILTTNDVKPQLIGEENEQIHELPYEYYLGRRIKYGITETIDFQDTATLPFECNLDWMRGINYNKGCYMGQELTIRTYTGNGTVRRVLPIIFNKPIPDIDGKERLEIRLSEEDEAAIGNNDKDQTSAYNPFGTSKSTESISSKPIRARRDIGKVGELLLNNGERGLARIEKRSFDWDQASEKTVKIVHNGKSYLGRIDTSIWN
jgi:folate-binding protein YgfZ